MQAEETTPLNVVIVDDHVALRRGMELLRGGRGTTWSAPRTTPRPASPDPGRRPDVALVDLWSSGADCPAAF